MFRRAPREVLRLVAGNLGHQKSNLFRISLYIPKSMRAREVRISRVWRVSTRPKRRRGSGGGNFFGGTGQSFWRFRDGESSKSLVLSSGGRARCVFHVFGGYPPVQRGAEAAEQRRRGDSTPKEWPKGRSNTSIPSFLTSRSVEGTRRC